MFLVGFPLLIIPLAIYNMIVFLTPDVPLAGGMTVLPMVSGVKWELTFSDMVVLLALLLLLIEIVKSTGVTGKSIVDHLLSFLVLAAAAAELVLVPKAATSTFVLLTAICLVDFLGGLAGARGAARRRRLIQAEAPRPAEA